MTLNKNHRSPCLTLLLCLFATHVAAAAPVAPYLRVAVDHPIVVYAGPKTTVTLYAHPIGFTPTRITWTQAAERINHLNAKGTASFVRHGVATTAVLPAKGVYEFQATATSAAGSFTAKTWVQVWDNRTALEPGKTLGTSPGITPPTSVRQLSPTPPAYQHPRVLFTDADWPEMHKRATTGKVAGWGMMTIRQWVKDTFDNPQVPTGKFAAALDAWAQGGMTGTPPDPAPLTADSILSSEGRGVFTAMLLDACYLQWLDNDPTQSHDQMPKAVKQRGAYLARLTAAAAKVRLSAVWDRSTGKFHNTGPLAIRNFDQPGEPPETGGLCDLALAYDLIYNWMEESQRQDARDFLFAAGWGRHTSFGGWDRGTLRLGSDHNGDFGNLNDYEGLAGLAVEGEEAQMSMGVQAAFGHAKPKSPEERWVKPADPSDPAAWPTATVASVENEQRQIAWLVDWFTTPWGLASNHLAYLGFTAKNMLPSTLAYSRRGENLFVTTNLYQLALHALLIIHPGEKSKVSPRGLGETNLAWFDHHDSGSFGQRGTMCILWKYMYPDDPLVDYVWRAYLPDQDRDPLVCAMFGLDPSVGIPAQTLSKVGETKHLRDTIFDPQRGVVDMHSAWDDDAASLWFECNGSDPYAGHMHAERNSFDFFALGRTWACAPGYHETISDLQSAILVKDPRYADDPATGGFLGESASSATQHPPLPDSHPTPPGKILQMTSAPDHAWTLVAGDATLAYNDAYQGKRDIDTGLPLSSWLYPGLEDYFLALDPRFRDKFAQHLMVGSTTYNPMRSVIRTVLFVRGPRPYALIVDDDDKDGAPHDWQWVINCQISFGEPENRFVDAKGNGIYSSLAMMPGATADEAVLYHSPIDDGDKPGLPRLLVRDIGLADLKGQPPILLQSRPPGRSDIPYLTYGFDNNRKVKSVEQVDSNRVIIERDGVAKPSYAVLMIPFRTGEPTPVTTWNADRTILTIRLGQGIMHTIHFDRTNPDGRTRLIWQRATPSVP